MENTNQFLGTERVGKLMRRYAVPCIISLLVGALYNIVDQIFIANASYLGSYGNAANTVVFPLTVVALAIAVMIGDGCCAFVSISLGKGKVGEARKSVGSAVVLSVASSLVLTALYLIFADAIISMFGGTVNEETFHYAQEYFFYISLGIPFYMFGQAMNPVIRADGNPRFAMISTLAGAVQQVNQLTVIASDGYKDFVADLQRGIREDLYDRPTKATEDYFAGKTIVLDGVEKTVSDRQAHDIYRYLIKNDYIDDDDHVSDQYRTDLANNALAPLPDSCREIWFC